MKKIKILTTLMLPIMGTGLLPLVSCNKNKPADIITITFVSAKGGVVSGSSSINVKKGTLWQDVEKPKPVANDGYYFVDWYNGDTLLTRTTKIDESISITAKFEKLVQTSFDPHVFICQTIPFLGSASYEDGGLLSSVVPVNVCRFNNLHIGYVELNSCYTIDTEKAPIKQMYDIKEENFKTTITNKVHPGRKASCVIDYKNQTIIFDSVIDFSDVDANSFAPFTNYTIGAGMNYFVDKQQVKYTRGTPIVIDLNKYNIRAIWYENKGYLPFEFMKNVLNHPIDVFGGYDFTGNAFYQIAPIDQQIYYNFEGEYKRLVKQAAGDFYNLSYMQYVYDLLALTLDLRYGMIQRNSRANDGKTIKYLENGALKALEPYHDAIVSLEDDSSSDAIRKMFTENLDDGGHTAYLALNAFSTKTVGSTYLGPEMKQSVNIGRKLNTARNTSGKSIPSGKQGYYEKYENAEKGNIAYITFDEFLVETSTTGWTQEEKDAKRELPDATTDSNYGNDTLRLTMYANKKVKEDNIKNLVLDLSLNRGGVSYSMHFLASWLCGGVTQKLYDPKSNSYCEYKIHADLNNDGIYDDKDRLDENVKVFIITSSKSFSCGNILPCVIRDQRPNTVFIGHNTGGGPCIVDTSVLAGASSFYQLSSTAHFLRKASNDQHFISMDDGCGIADWPIDEWNSPADFYKRDEINNRIWSL